MLQRVGMGGGPCYSEWVWAWGGGPCYSEWAMRCGWGCGMEEQTSLKETEGGFNRNGD